MWVSIMGFTDEGFNCDKPEQLEEVEGGYYLAEYDIVFESEGMFQLTGEAVTQLTPPINQDYLYFCVTKTKKQGVCFAGGFYLSKLGEMAWNESWISRN
jgi:hypothetical protein